MIKLTKEQMATFIVDCDMAMEDLRRGISRRVFMEGWTRPKPISAKAAEDHLKQAYERVQKIRMILREIEVHEPII